MGNIIEIGIARTALAAFIILFVGKAVAADQKTGESFAKDNCARCHATGKLGASPYAKAPPFRLIVHKYKLEYLQEALAEGIETGHNTMPEFILTTQQIDDLLAHLQSLK